jgi:hypothetical protein
MKKCWLAMILLKMTTMTYAEKETYVGMPEVPAKLKHEADGQQKIPKPM